MIRIERDRDSTQLDLLIAGPSQDLQVFLRKMATRASQLQLAMVVQGQMRSPCFRRLPCKPIAAMPSKVIAVGSGTAAVPAISAVLVAEILNGEILNGTALNNAAPAEVLSSYERLGSNERSARYCVSTLSD